MKREYLNVRKLSIATGISYDRIMRAVRFDLFDVFSNEEKEKLWKASRDMLIEHEEEHSTLHKKLKLPLNF